MIEKLLNLITSYVGYPDKKSDKKLFFEVYEPQLFGGYKIKSCECVTDHTGHYYLKPDGLKERTFDEDLTSNSKEELAENGLPRIDGWPAAAQTIEEYWELIDAYPGGCQICPPDTVRNLLSDVELNIPDLRVSINSLRGKKQPIPSQIISDIRRRHQIKINNNVVYDLQGSSRQENLLHMDLGDVELAKYTVGKCMKALNNNYELTINALTLTTQATMAHLGILITLRFSNFDCFHNIRCVNQKIAIECIEGDITSIIYYTVWEIYSMDNPDKTLLRYLKAAVEIAIPTEALKRGNAAHAIAVEKCSPFFHSFAEADNYDLNFSSSPSDQTTHEEYYNSLANIDVGLEEIHPLFLCRIFSCYPEIQKSKDENLIFLLADNIKFLSMVSLNGKRIYEDLNPESKKTPQDKANKLYQECIEHFQGKNNIIFRLLLLSNWGINNYLEKICCERYSNDALVYTACRIQYNVDIENPLDAKTGRPTPSLIIKHHSIWGICDPDCKFTRFIKIYTELPISTPELLSGNYDNIKAKHWFSPFFEQQKEALSYSHEIFGVDWIKA